MPVGADVPPHKPVNLEQRLSEGRRRRMQSYGEALLVSHPAGRLQRSREARDERGGGRRAKSESSLSFDALPRLLALNSPGQQRWHSHLQHQPLPPGPSISLRTAARTGRGAQSRFGRSRASSRRRRRSRWRVQIGRSTSRVGDLTGCPRAAVQPLGSDLKRSKVSNGVQRLAAELQIFRWSSCRLERVSGDLIRYTNRAHTRPPSCRDPRPLRVSAQLAGRLEGCSKLTEYATTEPLLPLLLPCAPPLLSTLPLAPRPSSPLSSNLPLPAPPLPPLSTACRVLSSLREASSPAAQAKACPSRCALSSPCSVQEGSPISRRSRKPSEPSWPCSRRLESTLRGRGSR